MTLVLEPRHVNAIRQHGEADYPAEACGLIGGAVEDGRKVAVLLVPLVNQRTDAARNRYLIDPESFRRAQEKRGRAGDMKSWTLSDDRAAFDEESITLEEHKAVWQ